MTSALLTSIESPKTEPVASEAITPTTAPVDQKRKKSVFEVDELKAKERLAALTENVTGE
jgi:hypothetical protein